jgi:hypothetical protein
MAAARDGIEYLLRRVALAGGEVTTRISARVAQVRMKRP